MRPDFSLRSMFSARARKTVPEAGALPFHCGSGDGKPENRVWRAGPDVAMVSTLVGKREFQETGFPDHSN
jgi:hypothetical protein